MNRFLTVLRKEIKDSARDRRALMAAMLPAIFGPLLMVFLFSSVAKTRSEAEDLTLPVIGRDNASDLIRYLEENDIVIETFEGNPKTEIQAKNKAVILAVPGDYGEKFSAFEPAEVQLFADNSLDKSRLASRRIQALISNYSARIGALRLIVRGVNPTVASPVRLETRDFSTHEARASKILGSLQMLLLMAAFFGGAPFAIDTTAGERERNSLEPLLVHPVTSLQIMSGKWITVVLYGLLASLIVVISTATALEYASLEALGVDPKLTLGMQVSTFLLLVPMALLASSAQMLASLFAKTFKEAQTYLGMLTLAPALPVMFVMFKDLKTASWMYLVPLLSQQQLLTSVMRGEGTNPLDSLTAAVVTTAVALGIFAVLTRLLRSERVVYGG